MPSLYYPKKKPNCRMLKQFNFPEKIWWQRITPIFSYFHQFVLQHTKNFETLIRSQNSA